MELSQEKYHLNTEQYIQQINSINEKSVSILNEFKKLYIIHKMHPENEEYQYQYENIVSNINKISSTLFTASNDIQLNIDDLNKQLIELNVSIKKEKKINKNLKSQLGMVEHKSNSTNEMINNYKEIYEKYYLNNWSILLSTFLCIYSISIVYKKPVV
jgi:signal recognition particle GTPase